MKTGRVVAVVFALGMGCAAPSAFPGDEVMGTFQFNAQPLSEDGGGALPSCLLLKLPDGGATYPEFSGSEFSFAATFSRFQDGGHVFLTVGGVSRDAGFDGQVADSTLAVPRRFESCSCATQLQETLQVALLSVSQVAVAGDCPANALDGGAPVDPDAGIFPPMSTDAGFDAARACGLLTDELLPGDGGCGEACVPCAVRYEVRGLRR